MLARRSFNSSHLLIPIWRSKPTLICMEDCCVYLSQFQAQKAQWTASVHKKRLSLPTPEGLPVHLRIFHHHQQLHSHPPHAHAPFPPSNPLPVPSLPSASHSRFPSASSLAFRLVASSSNAVAADPKTVSASARERPAICMWRKEISGMAGGIRREREAGEGWRVAGGVHRRGYGRRRRATCLT